MADLLYSSEAVITDSDNKLDNNRWFWFWAGQVIDDQTICDWNGLFKLNFNRLRRLKICGHARRVTELLNSLGNNLGNSLSNSLSSSLSISLSSGLGDSLRSNLGKSLRNGLGNGLGNSQLRDLELSALEIDAGSHLAYAFKSLQTLSIGQIRVVGQISDRKSISLHLDAPALKKVFFGSSSMQCVELRDYSSVDHLSVEDSDTRRLSGARYTNLEFFEFTLCQPQEPHEVLHLDPNPLVRLLQASTKMHVRFHLNMARITCTTYQPTPDQLTFLSKVLSLLKDGYMSGQIKGMVVPYFNYVEVDLRRPFGHHHFDRKLINIHEKYNVQACPWLIAVDYAHLAATILREVLDQQQLDGILRRFQQSFPCVQIVNLVMQNGDRPPNAQHFLTFLDSCRAIREMTICNTGYDESFYDQLFSLHSVESTINRFVHKERSDFAPLSYKFLKPHLKLCSFYTDSATCATMLDLVNRMRVDVEYTFKIRHPHKLNYSYDCIIRRTSELYQLTIHRFDLDQQTSQKSLLTNFWVTLEGIPAYLQSINELETFAQSANLQPSLVNRPLPGTLSNSNGLVH